MPLDLDQLRALSELKRRRTVLGDAVRSYEEAEKHCWQLGISYRQIAIVAGENSQKLWRRYTRMAREGSTS